MSKRGKKRKKDSPHWHCNKRWTDVNRAKEALSILESQFERKTWNEGKQSFYAILLKKDGLSESTNPRSTRAILGTFKFFGFAWIREEKVVITQAGKLFLHGDASKALTLQLLKWQYPNPFEAKGGVAPYTRSLKLFPFRTLLRTLDSVGPIHVHELALFVWKIESESQDALEKVKRDILHYRSLDKSQKERTRKDDPLFTTNHEYEGHLRPYILETGLCAFDRKEKLLSILPDAKDNVNAILANRPELKTDWKHENEWFEYYGNPKYKTPPRSMEVKLESKFGAQVGLYVKISRNGVETYGMTDDRGVVTLSVYEDQKYGVEVMDPRNGSIILASDLFVKPGETLVELPISAGISRPVESLEELMEKVKLLLTRRDFDDEIVNKLRMIEKITGRMLDKRGLRQTRGARFEELVYRLLDRFKKKVFDEVTWHGKLGEWGLPIAAQKVSEETGKKLPDILAFRNNDICVVETTLLKGRAQWEKPEAVSVPDHVEAMIAAYKGKNVIGVFVAGKLDPSVVTNLITRGVNNGYQIVPLEASEFLGIIKLMETSAKDFWRTNLDQLWNIHKRSIIKG